MVGMKEGIGSFLTSQMIQSFLPMSYGTNFQEEKFNGTILSSQPCNFLAKIRILLCPNIKLNYPIVYMIQSSKTRKNCLPYYLLSIYKRLQLREADSKSLNDTRRLDLSVL